MAVDLAMQLVARRHDAGALALPLGEPAPARGAGEIVGIGFSHAVAELLEGALHVAREARLDRFAQLGILLARDLVHDRRGHAGLLELGEGLPGIDGIELLLVAHQHHARDAEPVCDPEQIPGLTGGGERALVDHQHGLSEGGAKIALALAAKPPLGNSVVESWNAALPARKMRPLR